MNLLSENTDLTFETIAQVFLLIKVLNPTEAYRTLAIGLLSNDPFFARLNLVGGSGLQGMINQQQYAEALGGELPPYLSDPVVALVLVFWIVVVPLVGYWVFEEADL